MDEDSSLVHYGVRGMRWGVRKSRPSGGARRVKRSKVKNVFNKMRSKSVSAIKKAASAASKANDVARDAAEKHRDRKLTRMTQKAKIQEQEARLAQQKFQEEINKRNLKIENRSALNKIARKAGSAAGHLLSSAAKGAATSAANAASEMVKDMISKNTWNMLGKVKPSDMTDRQLEKLEKRIERQNKVTDALKKTQPKESTMKRITDYLAGGGKMEDLPDEDLIAFHNRLAYENAIKTGHYYKPGGDKNKN